MPRGTARRRRCFNIKVKLILLSRAATQKNKNIVYLRHVAGG